VGREGEGRWEHGKRGKGGRVKRGEKGSVGKPRKSKERL